MKYLETKYRVKDFGAIEQRLKDLGAQPIKMSETTHFYAQRPDLNVTKLVDYGNRWQIHELAEANGTFALTRKIDMPSRQAGLDWLRNQGYHKVQVVTMADRGFEVPDGEIGLYLINDWLTSVIVDVPAEYQDAWAQKLELHAQDIITTPYNVLLESLGRANFMQLATE